MVRAPKTPSEHKTRATRQKEIILAARKLIIRKGAEHVTVRGIAGEVGITEAAIYRHFKSKKDILSLLLDGIERTLVEDITKESRNGHTSLEALDAALRHQLSAIERRRGVSFQVIAEIISLGDKGLNRRASEVVDRYIVCIKDLLSEGIKAGDVKRDTDLEATATLLFAAVQGIINIWALRNYAFDPIPRYEPMWQIVRQAIEAPQAS
jgi:AcrR family transcriptional regulator